MNNKERLVNRSVKMGNGCIETSFKRNIWGYGQMKIDGKMMSCHRVSYEIYNGKIPLGISVLHKCDNPACVNPDHLFVGSHVDNMADMVSKNRSMKGEKNAKAKLTKEDIKKIRISSKTAASISREIGMSRKHIERIKRGLFWRDIPIETE